MANGKRVYLALGDSISIDQYTGIQGGGAVSQFYGWLKWLGQSWVLDDKTANGYCMSDVSASAKGDLITLTIGGNDLLSEQDLYLRDRLGAFAEEHLGLLTGLRSANPGAFFIIGNIYAPQTPLPDRLMRAFDEANSIIATNVQKVGAYLADIRHAFRGHEHDYLCYEIEPSLKGAAVIASLFKDTVLKAGGV
jgi:lysophospholipase L1-like esterase